MSRYLCCRGRCKIWCDLVDINWTTAKWRNFYQIWIATTKLVFKISPLWFHSWCGHSSVGLLPRHIDIGLYLLHWSTVSFMVMYQNDFEAQDQRYEFSNRFECDRLIGCTAQYQCVMAIKYLISMSYRLSEIVLGPLLISKHLGIIWNTAKSLVWIFCEKNPDGYG